MTVNEHHERDAAAAAQRVIDEQIQIYYSSQFREAERLTVRSAQGRLEFQRTQELVRSRLPARARILDVGGGTGVHAAALAAAGHEVYLVDPVPLHVEEARQHGSFVAALGDARDLPHPDDSFDAVLLFGPLYHLIGRDDRLLCLREARRVARPGGWVFAAAMPRVMRHAAVTLTRVVPHPYPADWLALLEHGVPDDDSTFPGAHFHTGEELEAEFGQAGLHDVSVVAIEGLGGPGLEEITEPRDDLHHAALTLVRAVGHLPGLRDLSQHMMGIGRVVEDRAP